MARARHSRTSSACRRSRRRPSNCLLADRGLLVLLARRQGLLGRGAPRFGALSPDGPILASRPSTSRPASSRSLSEADRRVGLRPERRKGLRRQAPLPRGASRRLPPAHARDGGRSCSAATSTSPAQIDIHPRERKPHHRRAAEERALFEHLGERPGRRRPRGRPRQRPRCSRGGAVAKHAPAGTSAGESTTSSPRDPPRPTASAWSSPRSARATTPPRPRLSI